MYFKHKNQARKKARRNLLIYILLALLVLGLYVALSCYEKQAKEGQSSFGTPNQERSVASYWNA